MVTTCLDENDLPDTDVLELELGNRQSARQFWATVLITSNQAAAERVRFCPSENLLTCTVKGAEYELVPPHADLHEWLMRVCWELAMGEQWFQPIYWLATYLCRSSIGWIEISIDGHRRIWVVEYRSHPESELVFTPCDQQAT